MKWLKQYIDYKGITIFYFEKSIETRSTISKAIKSNSNLRSDILVKILEVYPEINSHWLLTGEGEMLKKEGEEKKIQKNNNIHCLFDKQNTDQKLRNIYNQNEHIKLQEKKMNTIEAKMDFLLDILDAGSQQLTLNFLEIQETKVASLEIKKRLDKIEEEHSKKLNKIINYHSVK